MEHMFSQFVILPDSASPCFLVSLKIFFVSTSILWVKGWKRTCIPSGVCFLGKLSTLTIFSTYCTIHCICINLPTENVGWGYLAMSNLRMSMNGIDLLVKSCYLSFKLSINLQEKPGSQQICKLYLKENT